MGIEHLLDIKSQKIIVAPLCWGLGHATRCKPIVDQLLAQDNEVMIASDGEARTLLQQAYPELTSSELPSYGITYKSDSMMWNMVSQAPKLWSAVRKERKSAEELAKSWKADLIISDNRLGFMSAATKNIYVTHQLQILNTSGKVSQVASLMHARYYNSFDEIWVPDHKGSEALAGLLSESDDDKVHHIGPLSQFKKLELDQSIDNLIILSGPEPQRTIFEKKLVTKFANSSSNIVLVRGTDKALDYAMPSHIRVYDLLGSQELNKLICSSNDIYCRSGYTSIMDLVALGKTATLIPTPGQTEQEYLADHLKEKYNFKVLSQSEL